MTSTIPPPPLLLWSTAVTASFRPINFYFIFFVCFFHPEIINQLCF